MITVSWSGYESDGSSRNLTIRDQLVQLVGERDDDFSIPLGKNLKKVSPKFLTISQKRNIRRQTYLNEVSRRNDSVVFATIGAFVLLPPLVILGIAVLTGYVQLFPWYNRIYFYKFFYFHVPVHNNRNTWLLAVNFIMFQISKIGKKEIFYNSWIPVLEFLSKSRILPKNLWMLGWKCQKIL